MTEIGKEDRGGEENIKGDASCRWRLCKAVCRGERGVGQVLQITQKIGGKKVLEISEKFHKESNLAVWMLSRAGFSTHKDKVIQNWTKSVFELDRRFKEVGSMGLAY